MLAAGGRTVNRSPALLATLWTPPACRRPSRIGSTLFSIGQRVALTFPLGRKATAWADHFQPALLSGHGHRVHQETPCDETAPVSHIAAPQILRLCQVQHPEPQPSQKMRCIFVVEGKGNGLSE